MNKKIIIGSRGSDLALWQANYLVDRLTEAGVQSEVKIIQTRGDKEQELSFDKMEGKGFFTKEIEEALLRKEVDVAVHSHKDLETTPPAGLRIAAVSVREDPSELLLINPDKTDPEKLLSLKKNAIVGTSSARRKNQLLAFRPDVQLKDLRGNVPTRVKKLRDGSYDAILLAKAGVKRLNLDLGGLHVEEPDPRLFIPAPAQGVLAFQVREDDRDTADILETIHSPETASSIEVERKVLQLLDGGCQLPLGIYCRDEHGMLHIWASAAEDHTSVPTRLYTTGNASEFLAENIISRMQRARDEHVLITRELHESSLLRRLLEGNGFTVHDQSFIRFEAVPFNDMPETDWVFFSSKNSVRFFFGQKPKPGKVLFGAVGSATAAAIRKYGHEVAFTGEGNDTMEIAAAFKETAGKGRILFPQSDISLRTVQQEFTDESQVVDLITYKTITVDAKAPRADIIVFTSPSNARAYLRNHEVTEHQQVIAMGMTTGYTLEEHGISEYILPWSSHEVALADAVMSS